MERAHFLYNAREFIREKERPCSLSLCRGRDRGLFEQ
jgi:hypothetical protein